MPAIETKCNQAYKFTFLNIIRFSYLQSLHHFISTFIKMIFVSLNICPLLENNMFRK